MKCACGLFFTKKLVVVLLWLTFLFLIDFSLSAQSAQLDLSFNPSAISSNDYFNSVVSDAEIQADGKIIACGMFNVFDGHVVNGLVRMNRCRFLEYH